MKGGSATETGTEPQWPPKSPHEALMGTPSGRERYRRMVERNSSPSPSPSKPTRAPSRNTRLANYNNDDQEDMADETMGLDEEEDEEILQLKLQAIQAKLRLKKLQSAKAKKSSESDDAPTRPRSTSIPNNAPPPARTQSRADGVRPASVMRPRTQSEVQVPASPVRKTQATANQNDTSPSRVRLGIDKGLRGKDVSLKRAPSLKKTSPTQSSSQGAGAGIFRRAHTPSISATRQERPKTFSERLAAARTEEASRQERQARIRQARSTNFELGKDEMESFKKTATDIPEMPQKPEEFSREEVLSGARVRRSNTVSNLRRPSQDEGRSSVLSGRSFDSSELPSRENASRQRDRPDEEASASFEPYSSVHLSKRIIPHPVLTRNLSGKKAFVIKDLLKHVKAPDFELPEVEQDIVVFGILASKSDPRAHKPIHNPREKAPAAAESDPDRGKYMVLKLVDLQWELELFLFNSGFDRYWKLTPGTLLAVLNPTVMPPPPGRTDTGRFSLVINSGQDTILEVGAARDLGFCKSVKRDGALCNSWVNRKRTEFCEFHMNAALAKHRQARQDVNAFDSGLGPGGKKKPWQHHHGGGGGNSSSGSSSSFQNRRWGGGDDGGGASQGAWFVSRASSAASMLDNEMLPGQVAERVERGEALRRRLAAEEKERDLMKRLGQVGSGAGKEYMQLGEKKRTTTATDGSQQNQQQQQSQQQQVDAKSLGLLGGRGCEQPKIHLSPVKRKRVNTMTSASGSGSGSGGVQPPSFSSSGMSSSSASSRARARARPGSSAATHNSSSVTRSSAATGLGWGGGLKDKLARMKDGARLQGEGVGLGASARACGDGDGDGDGDGRDKRTASQSPVRKKTRFVTEKGIREAGRDSLGGEQLAARPKVATTTTITAAEPPPRPRSGVGTRVNTSRGGGGRIAVVNDYYGDGGDDDDDDELVILR